jgi:hypothetical protein
MFDQRKNQNTIKCDKCKKLHPDTGLYAIWETRKDKPQIIKNLVCPECFNTEKEKMILE